MPNKDDKPLDFGGRFCGYTSAKGQGPWETDIICNEAPSITDLGLNTFLDTDQGNDWFLDVQYLYYTATITEL